MKELKIALEKLKYLQRAKKEMEIDLEIANGKLREKEYENNQLTEYYHRALEDLAITCSELDNLKDHNAETTQRLKDQLKELNSELEIIHQNKGRKLHRSHTLAEAVCQEAKLKNALVGKTSIDMVDTLLESLSGRLKSFQT
jgi:chromosome segregation ATPase